MSSEIVKKPDFFIVGAPRCGTTALSEYLRSHPEVFMSTPKEPNYFSFDMNRPRAADSLKEYLALFKCADGVVAGEASVWYLYSKVAIPEIMKFNPNAKIIAIVRNPIDWVQSWHAHRLYRFQEDEPDISVAWKKQDLRKEGRQIPPLCNREPELLQYKDAAMFGEQIERAMNAVPGDQIKIIVFDDFVESTNVAYETVLSFLNVPSDRKTDFLKIHENKSYRSLRIANFLKGPRLFTKQPPFPLGKIFRALRKRGYEDMILKFENTLRKRIESWNSVTGVYRKIPSRFNEELINTFGDDIEKLSLLIDRDLSHWMQT